MRIAVVAPSSRFSEEAAERVTAIAARAQPDVELISTRNASSPTTISPARDAARADALVEAANDPAFDAIWFARGGYGACRIAEAALGPLRPGGAGQGLARL